MNLINATQMEAGYTMAVQPDGRELLVVVVKGTFTIPENGEEPQLAEKQMPLVMTDEFTGEPGFSAPLYENDFAPRKPHCDVLLNGTAYAPHGNPASRVTVSLRVGDWSKSFDVVGDRHWKVGVLGPAPSEPEPFTTMPISYDNAFGGVDKGQKDSEADEYFLENHVGKGFHARTAPGRIDGKPLPNTEECGKPISKPNGNYRPMSFGPLGRAWKQRIQFAGTYDQQWLDEQFPFLPTDFQDEYYQAAPADQWIDCPQGGEEVESIGLTPGGHVTFQLPMMRVPCVFILRTGERIEITGKVDTLFIEPHRGQLMMSARCALLLKKNIHEVRAVVAGAKPQRWYEEEGLLPRRAPGKQRFESLNDLIQSAKTGAFSGR